MFLCVGNSLFDQFIAADIGGRAGKMQKVRVVGIGCCSLSDNDVEELQAVRESAGGTDADDLVYIIEVEKFIRIDADGGHAHPAAHDGNFLPFIGAGVAEHVPDFVDKFWVFEKILSNEFCAQRVARHEDGLRDFAQFCTVMRGGGVCHGNYSFVLVLALSEITAESR